MRYKIIVNPLAGRGFGQKAVPQIQHFLAAQGLDFEVEITAWAGHAIELARQAVLDGFETVVAAGGDGTFQEVINGMIAAADSDPATKGQVVGDLGVIPVGSGSDFAWSVDVPFDLEAACAVLARHQTKVIDVGRVTVDNPVEGGAATRYFDNNVGIGFEGVVTLEARRFKRLRGIALYLPVVLRSVFVVAKAARAVVEFQGEHGTERREGQFLMIDACNGGRAGGSFFIAPNAKSDDGLLDLCLLQDMSRFKMLGMIPQFLRGTHVHHPSVTTLRSRHMVVTSADNLIAHTDGEMLCTEGHRIECEIVSQRVRVVC